MSTPKKHHFIPKGLLRNFAFDKNRKKINFIDKHSGELLSSSIGKVARQHFLYRYSEKGPCIEKSFFGDIDNLGVTAIDKIIDKSSLAFLSPQDKKNLMRFVAAQMLRVPATLKQLEGFEEDIRFAFDGEYSIIKDSPHSDFLDSIVKGVDVYESLLSKKSMTVFYFRDPDKNFIIGDVPVTQRQYGLKSTSQLSHSPAIPIVDWDFIALPISPNFLLVYYNDAPQDELKLLALENNNWQFIQSEDFLYSRNQSHLSAGLKDHYKTCYRYVQSVNPAYLKQNSIKFGDRIEVARPILAFSENAKQQMRSLLSQASK